MDEPTPPTRLDPPAGSSPTDDVDVVTWTRGALDAVRAELRALTATVGRQQAAIEHRGRAEADVVDLAERLPGRLGEAIAAAVEARQEAFLSRADGVVDALQRALAEVETRTSALVAQLDRRHEEAATATERAAGLADLLRQALERTEARLAELDARVEALPAAAATRLDEHASAAATRLEAHATDIARRVDDHAGVVDGRLAAHATEVERRLDDTGHQLLERVGNVADRVGERLDRLGERLDQRVDGLAERTDRLTGLVEEAAGRALSPSDLQAAIASGVGPATSEAVAEALAGLRAEVSAAVAERLALLAPTIEALPDRLADAALRQEQLAAAVSQLDRRLEQLVGRVEGLPGPDAVASRVSDSVRTLRTAVDDAAATTADRVAGLERRLLDTLVELPEATGEALAALSRKADEIVAAIPAGLSDDVRDLGRRVDELAAQPPSPPSIDLAAALGPLLATVGDLRDEVAALTEAVAAPIELDMSAFDDRLDELAAEVHGRPASESLDLTPVLTRLERVDAMGAELAELTDQVAELNTRIRSRRPLSPPGRQPTRRRSADDDGNGTGTGTG